jgi:hypothetical protein
MSSYSNNAVLFDEEGDSNFHYSSKTKKLWQHSVTVPKIVFGSTLNVLNRI